MRHRGQDCINRSSMYSKIESLLVVVLTATYCTILDKYPPPLAPNNRTHTIVATTCSIRYTHVYQPPAITLLEIAPTIVVPNVYSFRAWIDFESSSERFSPILLPIDTILSCHCNRPALMCCCRC
jgi:hypothetical protein